MMKWIFLLLVTALLIIVVSETAFYYSMGAKSGTDKGVTLTPTPGTDGVTRINSPNFYQIDKSYVDIFVKMRKGLDQTYYLVEKKGKLQEVQLNNPSQPDLFCFQLVNDQNLKYCLGKKQTKVFYLNLSDEERIVPYTYLKNGDSIIYSEKHDMSKSFDDPSTPPQILIQVLNNGGK